MQTELINMKEVVKTFQYRMHYAEDNCKYPFVLGRRAIELNHNPLLANNVVLALHHCFKIDPTD